ncbi:P-loop containing nucleoside triphosphate hydrolase protein [Aspergillus coremiiformis]|uniref:P-loop containing nucleoside triphosphate hydrolase protein n=1 Tax=Aspergillus coremiiformis TaxID=138285 RepID=A0A5N6YSB5_9EURO|nr:P-loop containing nucleoside triphosphate hydrolase protein [Aspergillus coremiiformis]
MVKLGKNSKRTPVRLRHKIEKASAAKQRKQRKLAKKNPEWRSKLKKDPGIPNLFPHKDRILHEIEEKKRLKVEEQERIREEARARKKAQKELQQQGDGANDMVENDVDLEANSADEEMDEDDAGDSSNPMAALLASARARAAEFDDEHESDDDDEMDEDDEDMDDMDEDEEDGGAALGDSVPQLTSQTHSKESSRRQFDKVFKQVVDTADVVLYVLDARDPQGTRSKEVEREIMAAAGGNKRMILILNKIDLIPPPVLKNWLVHLRRYFPTLPLKASNGTANAHSFDHKQLTVKGTSETLFKALKSYAHSKNLKRSISVGVIGYPNVGKSSVINALTARLNKGSSNACPTGAEAGVTTNLREVKLDNKLKLIDSPGIVFPNAEKKKSKKKQAEERARLVLLNAIPPKQIEDPVPAVSLLLKRLSASEELMSKLLQLYHIPTLFPSGDQTTDFLVHVARQRGRLGKHGVPNLEAAAMTVINDWRDGRIQGWVDAPVLPVVSTAEGSSAPENVASGVDTRLIVTEWAKEFKIEGLWGDGADEEMAE